MRHDPHACMIFAAGFGTRMAPLTDTKPKPLIEVGGKTMLRHALDPAFEAELEPILVNAHYLADQIETALPEGVLLQREEPTILDTGGGLKAALPRLPGEAVFTMNSDAVWTGPNPYETLRAAWDPSRMEALVLCVPQDRAEGRDDDGDFTLDGDVITFRTRGEVFYTGAQIIRRDVIERHPDDVFSFQVIWDEMITRRALVCAIHPGRWCDVGRPSSIPFAEAMIGV